jgi:hypothetical protein
MSHYKLEKPYYLPHSSSKNGNRKGNRWLVFPNAVISDITIGDCNDTVNGVCEMDTPFDDCLQICKEGDCGLFYQISGNICVPVKTGRNNNNNPAFTLRNRSFFPEMKNVNIDTVIDTHLFPFPPNDSETVMYADRFFVKPVGKPRLNKVLYSSNGNQVMFTNEKTDQIVSASPVKIEYSSLNTFNSLEYKEIFKFTIPGTNLVMKESDETLNWISGYQSGDQFMLVPTRGRLTASRVKTYGKKVSYADEFFIAAVSNKIKDNVSRDYVPTRFLSVNGDNKAVISSGKTAFKFQSQGARYYCDVNHDCNQVPKDHEIEAGLTGFYNGLKVSRNPECWGLCRYYDAKGGTGLDLRTKKRSRAKTYFSLILALLIVIGVVLLG